MQALIAVSTLVGMITLIGTGIMLYWISFSAMYSLMEAWWCRGHYSRKSKHRQLPYALWAFVLYAIPVVNTIALLICVVMQIVKVRRHLPLPST